VLPDSVEIIGLGLNVDILWDDCARGFATPSLIVVDQPKGARQAIHFWKQIVVVEIWSAMEDEER
jgi:hypothetical protein